MSALASPVDLNAALAEHAAAVEEAIESLLPLPEGPERRLLEAMRYATLGGGKRMRGFLVMEVARLFSVANASAARVAASVEMLHAYSLIHDDLPCMDDDDLRRGKPSTHKAFDEATAILAGDALQARAFEILADPDTHSDPAARCDLVCALGQAAGARGMVGGQMIDMATQGQTLTAAEIGRLQALKTGRLIQYSAEAGAILGRPASHVRTQVTWFGRDLGAAFQIADDVLDLTATTDQLVKTAGRDVELQKSTYPALLGIDGAKARAAALVDEGSAALAAVGLLTPALAQIARFTVERTS